MEVSIKHTPKHILRMASAYASAGFDWSGTPYECRHDDSDEDNADSADKKVECTERI